MIYSFEGFEFDDERWELRADGRPLDAPPKAMQTLGLLLQHRHRVVTNAELLEKLWSDVVVSDASLVKAIRLVRKLLGDDGASQRMVRTVRGRGYRFVQPAQERAPRSASPTREVVQRRGVLGRERELAELDEALTRALAGEPVTVVVTGEAGSGKTCLVEHFVATAAERGVRVAVGRCVEEGGAPELWPWRQVAGALGAFPDDTPATGALSRALDTVASSAAAHDVASGRAASAARFRTFEAATAALCALAHEAPLVVLLEDLHTADEASVALARFLSRQVRDARLLCVLTARGPGAGKGVGDALSGLVRNARHLHVDGVDATVTALMLQETLGYAPESALVERVQSRTLGNPLFVSELARSLRTAGATRLESLPVPERVAEAIRHRLADLSDSARATVSAAAVIGRRFEVPLLERVLDVAPATTSVDLGDALDRGVVEADASAHGTFQFSHILIRDVLYDDLPARRRAELHIGVGEALADADGLALVPATLAHHFVRGALVGGYERAVRYSMVAGRHALEVFAFTDAVTHFESAVGMLRGQEATATRCDALVLLGEARKLAGDPKGALDAIGEAMALAGSIADSARFARAALERAVLTPESGMTNRPVVDLLTGALSALESAGLADEPAVQLLRARILSRCAMSHAFAGSLSRAEAMSDQAVAIARAHRSPLPLIHALQAAHWVAWRPGTAETRLAATEEMLREARASGDESTVWESYQARLTDLLELGRGVAFRRAQDELRAFASRTGDPRARWHAASMDATIATMEGRFDDAAGHAGAALQIGRRIEESNTAAFFGAQLWWLRVVQERAEDVLGAARDIVLQNPGHVGYRASLLRTYAELGETDAARAELERLAEEDLDSLREDWQLLPVLAHIAFSCDVVGDAERAELVRLRLAPLARYHVVLGPALIYHGPVSLYLARCERALGRLDEAVELIERALSESEEMGALTTELVCLRDLRATLERRGRPEDQERLGWARAREAALGASVRSGGFRGASFVPRRGA